MARRCSGHQSWDQALQRGPFLARPVAVRSGSAPPRRWAENRGPLALGQVDSVAGPLMQSRQHEGHCLPRLAPGFGLPRLNLRGGARSAVKAGAFIATGIQAAAVLV